MKSDYRFDFMTSVIRYSIVIPHYGVPLLLERLLCTIPERDDVQVIVVDDCSPDSDTYLQKYPLLRRSNVEFHVADKNGGGGYARNEGLKHARGKWVLFADADDLFVDGFCSVLDAHYYDPEDIVFFRVKSVCSDDISRQSGRDECWNRNCQEYLRTKDDKILRYKLTEPWGKMIRRELIVADEIWFDETRVANDYFFSVKAGYHAGKVWLAPDTIYIVTQREQSVSSGGWADTESNLKVRLDVAIRVQSFLEQNGIALTPMPIRGLMVLALKNYPSVFFRTLRLLWRQNISIASLFGQMLFYAYQNGRKR